MPVNRKLSKYLQKMRLEAGLSQRDLSEKLGLGSAQFISNMERCEAPVPYEHLKVLVKELELDPYLVIDLIQEERERYLAKLLKVK